MVWAGPQHPAARQAVQSLGLVPSGASGALSRAVCHAYPSPRWGSYWAHDLMARRGRSTLTCWVARKQVCPSKEYSIILGQSRGMLSGGRCWERGQS